MRLIKYNVRCQQLVMTKTGFNRVIYLERVSFCLRNEAAGGGGTPFPASGCLDLVVDLLGCSVFCCVLLLSLGWN